MTAILVAFEQWSHHMYNCCCYWATLVSASAAVVVSEQLFLPTYAVVVVSEQVLFPHVKFWLFLSSSCFHTCNCGCFWAVVVYSCSCFWVAIVSRRKICVCLWGSLLIVHIIVVVSKHFSLPYLQLSPTFTVICPEGIFSYNTDTTHFTPPSTRLPNYILCHRSQQTLIS